MKNIVSNKNVGFHIGKLYKFQYLENGFIVIYFNPPEKINLIPSTDYDPNITALGKPKGTLAHNDIFLLLETKEYSKQNTGLMYCNILKETITGWVLLDTENISILSE